MNIVEMIQRAHRENWAIGQFNMSNMELLQAIVRAANEAQSPVMVGVSMGTIRHAGLDYIENMMVAARVESEVPLYLHLDHGEDFAVVRRCIEAGFDSVMLDASVQSMEENVRAVREVVTYAHERGVGVEAQIGETWDEESGEQITVKTDPDEAADFVARTGIDYLAVSFGNTPGRLEGKADVDVSLLQAIGQRVSVPIVLHGGSSIPDDVLPEATKAGAAKINIDTAIRQAITSVFVETYGQESCPSDPRKVFQAARMASQQIVMQKMQLFGSAGRS